MKWIDIQERQPGHGQLVAVLEKRYPDLAASEVIIRLTYWGAHSSIYPLADKATHWCPLPAVSDSPQDDRFAKYRQSWPEKIKTEADAIEKKMREIAPRIEWRAEPASMIRDVQVGEPDTASMKDHGLVANFYAHGWRITGAFDTGTDVFTFRREITDEYFKSAAVDIFGYIAHEMAHALAHELLRGASNANHP